MSTQPWCLEGEQHNANSESKITKDLQVNNLGTKVIPEVNGLQPTLILPVVRVAGQMKMW